MLCLDNRQTYKDIMIKKAFTLSELLIALGVIAILTAISMPIIHNLLPDQNVVMAKRAFYTTETIISDLLNYQYCYPKQRARVGLDDGLVYKRCEKWKFVDGQSEKDNAQDKLLTLFASKLDVKEIKDNGKTIFTKDGMIWTFSNSELKAGMPNSYIYLTVDVNGDKEPNCGQTSQSTKCQNTRKYGFDKFTMKILARGKIEIKDCWAKLAVRVDKKLTGREDITSDCKELQTAEDKAKGCTGKVGDLCIKGKAAGGSAQAYDEMLKEIQKVYPNYTMPTYTGRGCETGDCGFNNMQTDTYNDNWQLAKDYCEKVEGGRLPTMVELAQIASDLYGVEISNGSYGKDFWSGLNMANKKEIYKSLGISENTDSFYLWSSDWNNNHAYSRSFSQNSSLFGFMDDIYGSANAARGVVCIKD